ncbi:hypothetical protein [Fusobacterium sp. IOR10]|uniref:hypothetical protein n=1 Tax=Fusobacterium sp. IOR10 TaxID=2665157 RepID=UPI0013D40758|nr:hypothetical protein [Fusobacterium sp. IOR10]
MEKHEEIKKELKECMETFSSSIRKNFLRKNSEEIKLLKNMKKNSNISEKSYIWNVQKKITHLIEICEEVLEVPQSNKSWLYKYIITGQLDDFVRRTIEKFEGSSCSGDKESFTIGTCINAIRSNKNISLYQTYDNDDKKAYWSPASFKDTDSVFKLFESYLKIKNIVEQGVK